MAYINTGSIAGLLRPGVNEVFGNYDTHQEQYTEIFKTYSSTMAQEFDIEMKFLGTASIIPEATKFPIDSMGQRVTNSYKHVKVGNSFIITKEAIEDNLYKNSFMQEAKSLRNSLKDAKNQLGTNILNNAFDTNYTYGDGQPACSASHPIDGGTYSNLLVAAGGATIDFSEGGVESMVILSQQTKSWSGLLTLVKAKKMILHRDLQFAAIRLLQSAFRVDTANNDVNALHNRSYIPEGFRINEFLISPSAWFLLSDSDGLKHFQRTNVETDTYADMDTKSVKISAMERYSFGLSNPRALFGSPGV